jgi:hypothetical protein
VVATALRWVLMIIIAAVITAVMLPLFFNIVMILGGGNAVTG